MKGSDNKEDFKLNVLQVLGWVHDLDKSLETRKNQIYDRLNDKYPNIRIFVDKSTYAVAFYSRVSVVEKRDGFCYLVWLE